METEIRSIRALVRRMKFAIGGLRSIRVEGVSADVEMHIAREEDLEVGEHRPSGLVIWAPGKNVVTDPSCQAAIVAVVAAQVKGVFLNHLVERGNATVYMTLREWVEGWPVGSFIASFMRSEAVGSRLCRTRSSSDQEWIFTRELVRQCSEGAGEQAKFLLVTGLKTGLFPIMPATVTSICLVPLGLLLWTICNYPTFLGLMVLLVITSTWGCLVLEKWAARKFFAEDPREFVLDEVAGLALAWTLLPPDSPWWGILLGFLLFRVFDIFKWGVHWIETVPIPGRIVWDDLIAGAYAGGLSALILTFFF